MKPKKSIKNSIVEVKPEKLAVKAKENVFESKKVLKPKKERK